MRTFAFRVVPVVALFAVTIIAPVGASAQNVLANVKPTKHSVGKTIAQATEKPAPAAKPETAPAAEARPAEVKVTVAEGESLSSIATTQNTTWVRLYNANEQIANPNIINPGDQLRVPNADEQLADRPLPVEQPVAVAAPAAAGSYTAYRAPTRTYAAATGPVSGNAAKDFIYSRESGNNPNATNPGGCYGIGQDCNGVVRSQCGADYACQDAYFTGYAERRYGGWEGAYSFWQNNGWW
ncbi:MAG: resuscitation-promoting factor RpfB [Patescibacteria group bacterium]|nr:LysM peptidoglycan-binding domain-containing protein [Candidatus Saccharibacteria bacterium]MDQ5963334.1 resuscitation-promoting factor RpfB [Patescibacteria group bacterium]